MSSTLPVPTLPVFEPSEGQRRLLQHIYATPGIGTIESLCHHANVSRATYYRWCRNPAFRQWFALAWASRIILDGATHLNIARANAQRSYPYWKAMFDLIFSPKGLSQLLHWQETCGNVADNAFDVPGLEPDPDEPPPAPARVSLLPAPQPPPNQHPPSAGETKQPPIPVPLPRDHRIYHGPDYRSAAAADCCAGGAAIALRSQGEAGPTFQESQTRTPRANSTPAYPHHLARLLHKPAALRPSRHRRPTVPITRIPLSPSVTRKPGGRKPPLMANG